MTVTEGIRNFVDKNSQYKLCENYTARDMEGTTCLGVVVKAEDSFMDFLFRLTQYLEEQEVDDVDLELEGVSYDLSGLDTIVYFPNIKGR